MTDPTRKRRTLVRNQVTADQRQQVLSLLHERAEAYRRGETLSAWMRAGAVAKLLPWSTTTVRSRLKELAADGLVLKQLWGSVAVWSAWGPRPDGHDEDAGSVEGAA